GPRHCRGPGRGIASRRSAVDHRCDSGDPSDIECELALSNDSGRNVRAVLYDFDGTLADTTELVMTCYRLTMQEHLGEVPPAEEWLRGFGTPLEVQMNRFARDPSHCEEMIATYRLHQEEQAKHLIRSFDGVLETLAELRSAGMEMAFVTSRHKESTLRALDLCGLTDHFEVVVTPQDV